MGYCFMNLRRSKEELGWEPDFPEGVDCLLLADCRPAKWALYEFRTNAATEDWTPESPISDELVALLESGKKFPPALALARDRVSEEFNDREPTREEFVTVLADSLCLHISRQPDAGYFLAPALRDAFGLCKGEWYWILGIAQSYPNVVRWVSSDFFVYENAITDFDFTKQQLEQLRNRKV